jgi:hypothetical protein
MRTRRVATYVVHILAVCAFLFAISATTAAPAAHAQGPFTCTDDQPQVSGALYRICMPASVPWNKDLVVFAHGYVAPNRPIEIPEDQLSNDNWIYSSVTIRNTHGETARSGCGHWLTLLAWWCRMPLPQRQGESRAHQM